MRDLERQSGVNRWILSLAEQGRLIPTGEEFAAVMAVLQPQEEAVQSPGDPAGVGPSGG